MSVVKGERSQFMQIIIVKIDTSQMIIDMLLLCPTAKEGELCYTSRAKTGLDLNPIPEVALLISTNLCLFLSL